MSEDESRCEAASHQKTVLLGVTGCIAAYKSCEIVRLLQKAGVRPKQAAPRKLKKGEADAALGAIELVENPDILATLASSKKRQVVVGFAAETDDVVANAEKKLSTKHADLVVANQVGEGKAFGTDDNQVWFVDDEGVEELPRMSKERLADAILDKALEFVR